MGATAMDDRRLLAAVGCYCLIDFIGIAVSESPHLTAIYFSIPIPAAAIGLIAVCMAVPGRRRFSVTVAVASVVIILLAAVGSYKMLAFME